MANRGEKSIAEMGGLLSPQRGENVEERTTAYRRDGFIENGEAIDYRVTEDILSDSKAIIDSSQRVARKAVNVSLVLRNWFLGKRIVEEELCGHTRSELYGREVIDNLSRELNAEYGKGFGRTSLYQFARFYRLFPEIVHGNRVQSLSLTWTHYRHLLRVDDPDARAWYEKEAIEQSWAEGTLGRNIATQYYYRMLMTADRNKPSVEEEMCEKAADFQSDKLEFVKNPVIAEFLGFSPDASVRESELEGAIIANLQQFLLELGKGYAFVARQQHIRTDAQDYFIDLVFYNIILKCYVLIDLKVGVITHQDVGQMDMYVRMYDELKRAEGDGPTLGIVLCSETSEDIARYSVLKGNEQLFASKYRLYLPTEEQLRAEIEMQKRLYCLQQSDTEGA